MVKVFDCFTFFNELDLLDIRLNELSKVVDYFVIVESEETFTGKSKPLVFEENRERFSKFESQIIYVKKLKSSTKLRSWDREHAQRNELISGLQQAKPSDIIILSDVDEIISLDTIEYIKKSPPKIDEVYCLELRYFHFYLNLELPNSWLRTSPRAVRFGSLRDMRGLRSIRPPHKSIARDFIRRLKADVKMRRFTRRIIIPNAGWHFSWLGGKESVAAKAQSISVHSNLSNIYSTPSGAERMIDQAIGNLQIREIDYSFPKTVWNNREKYSHLILNRS